MGLLEKLAIIIFPDSCDEAYLFHDYERYDSHRSTQTIETDAATRTEKRLTITMKCVNCGDEKKHTTVTNRDISWENQ
jgi:hypothetical protein